MNIWGIFTHTHTHIYIYIYIYMPHMKSLTWIIWPAAQYTYFRHIDVKYDCHTAIIGCTAIILNGHISPPFLHKYARTQCYCQMWAITSVCTIFEICAVYVTGMNGGCIHLYMLHMNSLASAMWRGALYEYLTYINEQIGLKHVNIAQLDNMLYWHMDPTFCIYMSKHNQLQHLHIIDKYVPETKMPKKLGMYAKYFMSIYVSYTHSYATYGVIGRNHASKNIVHMTTTKMMLLLTPPPPSDQIAGVGLWTKSAKKRKIMSNKKNTYSGINKHFPIIINFSRVLEHDCVIFQLIKE